MTDDLERKTTPWFNGGVDWEAVAAALTALLIGLLLGVLWSVLFWIAFVAMIAALMAGRWSTRAAPDLANGIVAPCDGVVVSITRADAPGELRLTDGETTRIRISSSPATTNRLYAPIAGSLESLITEDGERSVPLAMRPDSDGLAVSYLQFESRGQQVGVRLATGGFGPRQELEVETGDITRLGRVFGKRRLGGWCDVYVPADTGQLVWPGQTLIGGETVLGRLKSGDAEDAFETMSGEAGELPLGVTDEDIVEDDDYPEPDEADTPDDPAVMLARLKEATKNKPDD
jgi:phosphatidylserine decarboxylase